MEANRGRILCVDDEPHVVRALQWLLRKDFEVHTATNAADALSILGQHDFDVVVSDQRMPGVTGVEFLREVRKAAPRAMRILLTGYSDLDAMMRSVNESEIYRFVTKPWDMQELPKLVAEAVEISRSTPVVSPDPMADQPLHAAAANAATLHRPGTVALRDGESILLIDDDASVHRTVHEALGDTERVRYACNLAEAVHALDQSPTSVVISEVRVGSIDVTRLIRLMKQKHPEVVAVVFGGVEDARVVMDLINQGQVYRFIPKPSKPGLIRLIVDSAIKRHRQLVDSPDARRRYHVEAAGEEARRSLHRDVELAAVAFAGAGAMADVAFTEEGGDAGQGFMQRISGGFRRLFGT